MLYRLYLAVGVALAYPLFAIGCLGLLILSLAMRLLGRPVPQRTRLLRASFSGLCRGYMGYAHLFNLARVRYHHVQPLDSGLIVANHPSLIDVLWLLAAYPQVCCVVKAEIEHNWLLRGLARDLDYVSNRDPEQLLAEGTERLRRGELLLVFPEATRTVPGCLPSFRLGAAELLLRAEVAAHPVVLAKQDPYLSKAMPWYAFPTVPMEWDIVQGPALGPWRADQSDATRSAAQRARSTRRQMNAELEQHFHTELRAKLAPAELAAEN
ncbi:MAG: lysophospholipid acyltransferase family protein [Pseudomonadota bacterium]